MIYGIVLEAQPLTCCQDTGLPWGDIASLLSILVLVGGIAAGLKSRYKRTLGRKRDFYRRLRLLTTDVDFGYFLEHLDMGHHAFKDVGTAHIDYVFANEFAYVQVVTDEHGRVLFYSVTSHHDRFNPRIWPHKLGPLPDPIPSKARLGRVALTQVQLGRQPSGIEYFISGASAPSHYIEAYYFGNPGLYRTYFVGVHETGLGFFDAISDLAKRTGFKGQQKQFGDFGREMGSSDLEDWLQDQGIVEWRRRHSPNMYGVSCEHFSVMDPPFPIRLGPNPHKLRLLNE